MKPFGDLERGMLFFSSRFAKEKTGILWDNRKKLWILDWGNKKIWILSSGTES
jgi:hypothetical protein